MKMKIIALGILSMFLLTSLIAGAATSEKTKEATNLPYPDLEVTLHGVINSQHPGRYQFLYAKVTNVGDGDAYAYVGGLTLTLSRKGPLGLIPRPIERTFEMTVWKKTWTILPKDTPLKPGESINGGDILWMALFNIDVFQYKVDAAVGEPIEKLGNNIDSQRVLSKGLYMYFI